MKSLTAYNDQNARVIEAMVDKAMCAYANWRSTEDDALNLTAIYGDAMVDRSITAYKSEYEATVRCVAMFVRDSIYEIQTLVIERAKEELGV